MVIPPHATAEDGAPLIEFAPKSAKSIPACSNTVRNHLAMVLDVTSLCALMKDRNNFGSPFLNSTVLSK